MTRKMTLNETTERFLLEGRSREMRSLTASLMRATSSEKESLRKCRWERRGGWGKKKTYFFDL